MDNKLPLDSSRWQTLGGSSKDVPNLIRRVQLERDVAHSAAFDELADYVIHQYSCCEVTYAVVPYLVEIGVALQYEKSLNVWHWVGTIAATHNVADDPAPEDLLPAFRSALLVAESRCIESLLAINWSLADSYDLCVDAFALAGHPLGKLSMDAMYSYQDAESAANCPNCSEQVEVVVFDTGIVVVREGQASHPVPPEPGETPRIPTAFKVATRSPNPWAELGGELRRLIRKGRELEPALPHFHAAAAVAEGGLTPDVDPGPVFSLLGALIVLKGYPKPATRYFHAWDTISCPKCKTEFVFADHWWGMTDAAAQSPSPGQPERDAPTPPDPPREA